jgi:hypothetical protein
MGKVFVLIRRDRHVDDVVTVHTTEDGALDLMEEFVKEYGDERWKRGRSRYWSTGEGYSAEICSCEVLP